MNPATVEEPSVETGGISAESNASGLSINMIPKEGGNIFKFGADGMYTNEHLQSDNLTDDAARPRRDDDEQGPAPLRCNVDGGRSDQAGPAVVLRGDAVHGQSESGPGVYFNKTQGTPFYTPDLDRPAFRQEWLKSQAAG